jgi:DNA-binding beta-propeller fold protein YncE
LSERRVETLCGNGNSGYVDGSFEESMFNNPFDISFNSLTEELYVSDTNNHIIRIISLKNRRVKTLCGTPQVDGFENGIHNQAKFRSPYGLGLDINSNCLFVCDSRNHVVRRISLLGEVKVNTLCGIEGEKGSRDGLFPTFNYPNGIVVDSYSQSLYVMDYSNNKVRKIIDRNRILLKEESPPNKKQNYPQL